MTRSEISGEIALSFESEAAYNKALADMEKLSNLAGTGTGKIYL